MRIGTSDVSMNVSRTLVENNYFEQCDGELEIISNKSCENVYRYNTFRRSKGMFTLRHGNRCVVESNWFFGDGVEGSGGIRVIGEDHKIYNNYLQDITGDGVSSALTFVNGTTNPRLNEYFQVKNAIVCFNTIVNPKQGIYIGVGKGARNRIERVLDSTIANNVIQSNGPIVKLEDEPTNMKWLGNIFGPAAIGADLPIEEPVDPKLTKEADGIWRPAPDTP